MGYSNGKECQHAGIDEKAVARIATRLDKVMADAERIGITLFCGGCSPTLRYNDGDESYRLLIVGHCMFKNADGGDGGYCEDKNGLLRGE